MRLEIEQGADPEIVERLRSNFALVPAQGVSGSWACQFVAALQQLYEQTPRPDLKFRPFTPKSFT